LPTIQVVSFPLESNVQFMTVKQPKCPISARLIRRPDRWPLQLKIAPGRPVVKLTFRQLFSAKEIRRQPVKELICP
jgi:hypothetical protein